MLRIAKLRLLDGLMDAKFLFLFGLVIIAFLFNGIICSVRYQLELGNYMEVITENTRGLDEASDNLQSLASYRQRFMLPPSPLAHIADGGASRLPNTVQLNAFRRLDLDYRHLANYKLPVLMPIDWNFIVGGLMGLLAIVVSFGVVCGDKGDGTLRQTLANPISRMQLFLGNYLGLLAALLIALALGIPVNLLTAAVAGGSPMDSDLLAGIGWAAVLAALYLSAFLLIGLAASSLTSRPAVSLVILLVIWVLAVVAAPGLARLLTEQMVSLRSPQEVAAEQERVGEAIYNSYPPIIGRFTGNPFDSNMPMRAEAHHRISVAEQRIHDEAEDARVRQLGLALGLASVSPYGLLSDGLQLACGTGLHGLEALRRNAERYRRMLHDFVVEADKRDKDSAHLVYAATVSAERNTFSTKPVNPSYVPGSSSLWTAGGLSRDQPSPLWQCLGLAGFNLLAGLAAFIALLRYDPR